MTVVEQSRSTIDLLSGWTGRSCVQGRRHLLSKNHVFSDEQRESRRPRLVTSRSRKSPAPTFSEQQTRHAQTDDLSFARGPSRWTCTHR